MPMDDAPINALRVARQGGAMAGSKRTALRKKAPRQEHGITPLEVRERARCIAERIWRMLADTPQADREAELLTLAAAAVLGGSSGLLEVLGSQPRGFSQREEGAEEIGVDAPELQLVLANETSITKATSALMLQAARTSCDVLAAARWLTYQAARDLPITLHAMGHTNGSMALERPPIAWSVATAEGVAEAFGLWLAVARDRGMPAAAVAHAAGVSEEAAQTLLQLCDQPWALMLATGRAVADAA
jgi:hypothetical protein